MGGSGSSRWGNYRRKVTVEQCHALDITELLHQGIFNRPNCIASISFKGKPRLTGEENFDIIIEADTSDPNKLRIKLKYSIQALDGPLDVEEDIRLNHSKPHYGGIRFWFKCPIVKKGEFCGKRSSKLFLPPGQMYFGCRSCYDLTYRKAQQHDKTSEKYRRRMWDMLK